MYTQQCNFSFAYMFSAGQLQLAIHITSDRRKSWAIVQYYFLPSFQIFESKLWLVNSTLASYVLSFHSPYGPGNEDAVRSIRSLTLGSWKWRRSAHIWLCLHFEPVRRVEISHKWFCIPKIFWNASKGFIPIIWSDSSHYKWYRWLQKILCSLLLPFSVAKWFALL